MRSTKLWICILCLLAFVAAACSPVQATPDTGPVVLPELEEEFTLDTGQQLSGTVVLLDAVNLSFPIPGQLKVIFVEPGDYARKGDPLARMDTSALEVDVEIAESSLGIAQANLEKARTGPSSYEILEVESDIANAQSQRPYNSPQATAQASSIISAQARLDYLKSLPQPEIIAVAEAELKKAETSVTAARTRLEQATLLAPFDGSVTQVFLRAFEHAGTGEPVAQLAPLNRLGVQAEITDFDAAAIQVGDTAKIKFEAMPGVELEGVVKSLTPLSQADRPGRFSLLVEILNPTATLQWGIRADVLITD